MCNVLNKIPQIVRLLKLMRLLFPLLLSLSLFLPFSLLLAPLGALSLASSSSSIALLLLRLEAGTLLSERSLAVPFLEGKRVINKRDANRARLVIVITRILYVSTTTEVFKYLKYFYALST